MTPSFVLHPAAAAELREITRYSLEQWGAEKTRAYTDKLKEAILDLAKDGGLYKDMSEIYPNLCCVLCGRHYIFAVRKTRPLLVVALLHERMDIILRLKTRLSP